MQTELQELHDAIEETVGHLRSIGHDRVEFGDLRRDSPISPVWGFDRGIPLDRYYIHRFLDSHRSDIRGRTLEVKESMYTQMFGDGRVQRADVVDINPRNPLATVVADLTCANQIQDDTYDCFVLTQTLGEIYEPSRAVREAFRILKPGGVLLCTVPASGRISCENGLDRDFWRFTEASVRTLFSDAFPIDAFEITTFGNVLARTAFLYGLAPHELTPSELDANDPFFPVVYAIRAVKVPQRETLLSGNHQVAESIPAIGRRAAGTQTQAAGPMYHRVAAGGSHRSGLSITPDEFLAHMQLLKDEGYNVLSLRELARASAVGLQERSVAITIDDG